MLITRCVFRRLIFNKLGSSCFQKNLTMASSKPKSSKHIDDEQFPTAEEHYSYLMNNEEVVDAEFTEVTAKNLPDWYDPELFKRGQDYYRTNVLGISTASFVGLVLVLVVPLIKKILVYTNQSSTPCSAFRRYSETLLHAHYLYMASIDDEKSNFWKSLNVIRWKHSNATRRCLANKIVGIKQQDMGLTQFGFLGFVLLQPKLIGLTDDSEHREGLCHFWRVLGHMLGIPAKVNICRKNDKETTELCRLINDRYYKKAIQENPPHLNHLVISMLDGTWYVNMSTNKDAFLSFVHTLVGVKYDQPLSLYSRFCLKEDEILFYLMGVPYIGQVIRSWYNFYLPATTFVLERYPIIAWIGLGVKESKINLYPNIKGRSS